MIIKPPKSFMKLKDSCHRTRSQSGPQAFERGRGIFEFAALQLIEALAIGGMSDQIAVVLVLCTHFKSSW